MRLFFAAFVSALALAAAPPQAQSGPAALKAAPKAADVPRPASIPAEAVLGDDGNYRYTDPEGKKWIFRVTPFGIAHREDKGERVREESPATLAVGLKATEDGDKVRFERPGPFGSWKWEKKISDLNEVEKAALENSRTNQKAVSKQD